MALDIFSQAPKPLSLPEPQVSQPEPFDTSLLLPVKRKFGQFDRLIQQESAVQNLPFDVVHSLASLEGMNPSAVSSAGAVGVMQVLPSTASQVEGRRVSAEELKDPEFNIRVGTKYLKQMADTFGSLPLGIAAYQAGPGNVQKAGNKIPDATDGISTTKQYVATILSLSGQDPSLVNRISGERLQKRLDLGIKLLAERAGPRPGQVSFDVPIPQPTVESITEKVEPQFEFVGGTGTPEELRDTTAIQAAIEPQIDVEPVVETTTPDQIPLLPFSQAKDEIVREFENRFFTAPTPEIQARTLAGFPLERAKELLAQLPEDAQNRIALEMDKIEKEGLADEAFTSGILNATPAVLFLGKEGRERLRAAGEVAPKRFIAGNILSTVAQAILGGSALSKSISKIPALSKPLVRNVATRMVTSGAITASQNIDDVIDDKKTFGEAMGDVAQAVGAGAISVLPEAVPAFSLAGIKVPWQAVQLIGQPLIDLAYDATVDAVRGREVGTKEWWKNEALNLGLSTGFALRDVASGDTFVMEQQQMRSDLKGSFEKMSEWMRSRGQQGFENVGQKIASETGLMFGGEQPGMPEIGLKGMLLFTDPETKTTFTAESAEEARAKLQDKRDLFQRPAEQELRERFREEQEAIGVPEDLEARLETHPTASQVEAAPTVKAEIEELTQPVQRTEVRPVEESELLGRIAESAKNVDDFVEATTQRGAVSFGKGSDLDKSLSLPTSVNPDAEARFREAKGIKPKPISERAKEGLSRIKKSFTRLFPELDPKTDGQLIDILRLHSAVPEYSKLAAASTIRGLTAGLGPKKMEVFEKNIIFPDIIRDIDRGLYDDKPLPFGYNNRAELEQDAENYRAILDTNPDIKQAVEARNRFMKIVTQEAVDNGLLPREVLENPSYFHHQVLEHMATKDFKAVGVGAKDVRLKKKGWQKGRIGSDKDFNTSYLESEFEVLSQMISQLETVKTLNKIKASADISDDLKAEAKEAGIEDWRQLVPDDHVLWQPKQGSVFYQANSLSDKVVNDVLSGNKELTPDDVKQVLAVGGKRAQWAVPERLAKTLDNFTQARDEGPLGEISKELIKDWKIWTLLNPFRVARYNINNLSGDLDIAVAYNPAILKEAPRATRELYDYNVRKKAPSAEILNAVRKGVIDSGFAAQEVPDISKSELFSAVTGKKPNLVVRGWTKLKDFTQYRENILRLAAYRHFKNELAKGKQVFGASKKSEIDAIENLDDKAAKLARELIGDYGAISQAGQWIRSHMMPFYCVPDDAEILTKSGWKTVYELNVNDDDTFDETVLSYNVEDHTTEWQPLEGASMFGTCGKHDIMTLSNKTGSKFLFTADHRWPVFEQYGEKRKIVKACDLKAHHKLMLVAPHKHDTKSILSPKEAALLAWIVTDGYFRWRGNNFEAMIYQSPKKHAAKIREKFGDWIGSESTHPDSGVICFRIKKACLNNILNYFQSKCDLPNIVTRIDKKCLEEMYEAMMDAEGTRHPRAGDCFTQKGSHVIDAFQIICYLLGKAFDIRPTKGVNGGYVRKRNKISLFKWTLGKEPYTGIVWCPKTPNGTWIMRQNGRVVITGNSWMEINAPRYVRMLKNLPHESEDQGRMGRVGGALAGKTAAKGAGFAAKAAGLYALVQLWNHTFFPDEERELGEEQRRQHIILGRTEDGRILSLRFQGAFSDALDWVAAEDLPADVADVVSGRATVGDKAKEAVTEGVTSRLWNSLGPQFKLPVELAAGVSTFPSPLKPRPVRERGQQVARVLSLDIPYRWARGIPTRGIEDDLMRTVISITDPGERAYFDSKNIVREFIEKETPRSAFGGSPSKKSNALYYYKKAIQFGDDKAARRWLDEYKNQGGTLKGIKSSVKAANPLHGLGKDKSRFVQQLTAKERQTIDRAQEWYKRVYR